MGLNITGLRTEIAQAHVVDIVQVQREILLLNIQGIFQWTPLTLMQCPMCVLPKQQSLQGLHILTKINLCVTVEFWEENLGMQWINMECTHDNIMGKSAFTYVCMTVWSMSACKLSFYDHYVQDKQLWIKSQQQ